MKTITVEAGVALIPDGASLMIGGFMTVGTPERLVTEFAVIGFGAEDQGSPLEIASGVCVEKVVAATETTLRIPNKVAEMVL